MPRHSSPAKVPLNDRRPTFNRRQACVDRSHRRRAGEPQGSSASRRAGRSTARAFAASPSARQPALSPGGDECLEGHEMALGHAIDARSLEDEAAALGGIGDAQYLRGHMATANEQFAKCVKLSQQHGLGRLKSRICRWSAGPVLHERHARCGGDRRQGHRTGGMRFADASRTPGTCAGFLGRRAHTLPPRALADQFDRSLALACTLGSKRFEAQMYGLSALITLRSGQRELARSQVERGLSICREHGRAISGPGSSAFLHRSNRTRLRAPTPSQKESSFSRAAA